MNLFKKAVVTLLVVLMCATTALPVYATQDQNSNTDNQQTVGENFTETNETVYAVATVNIRVGPGTNYEILTQLRYGYSVTRIGIGENGWSMVLWEGQVVYIFSSYLSTRRPEGYNAQIDDTALLRQIAVANGLNRADYTQESWQAVSTALLEANSALNGNSQPAADDAEKALAKAINNLVKMDYSNLSNALAKVTELTKTSEMTGLWYELADVAQHGWDLMTSGDQKAVDATADQILVLVEQVREEMGSMGNPNVVIQEVPVEVPPTDDFCNIPMHRVWPVLFAISAVLNAALVTMIVIYIRNKKKNQQDDTPLVDYDIMDDAF